MQFFQWPAAWRTGLPESLCQTLRDELERELPAGHILKELAWVVIAQLVRDQDWIALSLADGRFAAAHLTWSVEQDPRWPSAEFYGTLEELCDVANWN